MDAKTKEEIELLQELIDSPDTPQDEKELYRDTIKELKAEAEKAEKSKPEPKETPKKTTEKTKSDKIKELKSAIEKAKKDIREYEASGGEYIDELIGKKLRPLEKELNELLGNKNITEKKPATAKTSATKKEAPKKLPVDADKMKAEIKERTGKTEEECEVIIAEYRQLREKSKKIEAKRLGKLDDEGKLIAGTKEKTAAAVIETAAENIKDKLEKQVDKLEKEAEKGDRTPEQIEARINKNLGQLSKEMTKQATGFIKGIQSELAKADKTEAKQFLMNVRAEIDDLLSKFGGGGSVGSGKIYILTGYSADATKDSYEEGELENVGSWSQNIVKEFKNKEDLIDFINKQILFVDYVESDFDWEIGEGESIHTDVLCSYDDYNGYFPAEEKEKELWKKGKKDLFNVHYMISVRAVTPTEYARGGWLRDRRQVNQREDYEVRYEKNKNTGRTSYAKKKNSVGSTFGGGGGVDQNGYIAFYKGKQTEVYANTSLEARNKAAVFFKAKKPYEVTVVLAEKNGEQVVHKASFGGGGGVNSLSEERRAFLQELIDNGIIDEEHYYFEETTDTIKSNDNEQMRVLIDEMVSSDIIDKSYPDYKRALKLSKKQFSIGGGVDAGFVQTYNITQGNMSSSSVNPSQFGEGGGVDGKEIIDLGKGFTIEVNKVFYESGDYTYGALLNYNGELFKYFVIMPNETREDAVKNIYNYLGSLEIKGSDRKVKEGFPRKGQYLVIFSDRGNSEIKRVFDGVDALKEANKFVKDIETISAIKFNKDNLVFGEGGDIPPYVGERFSQEEFDYRLNLAKHQIISDIMEGMVDASKVNDFGDLGAFVDNNYYGGFIEDDYDHSEGFVFEMSVQDALADWIEEGGITKALENPEMFAVGGSVEDAISNADARIANLRELRSVSNDDMRENLDFQIESIEREKARLLSGEVTPRKRLFGLF
jgi:hypothetical protein